MHNDTQWSQALRYRPYNQWSRESIQKLIQQQQTSSWRLAYHIQPESGLLNDPNGFSYYQNQWHVFYQAYPMGPVHGLKSWKHLVSDDLIHWQPKDYALLPDTPFDSHGVYSGSALPVADKLFLMYTGNVRDQEWQRYPYQLGAWMDAEWNVTKVAQPLIPQIPTGYTDHFRDPQIFRYNHLYWASIGAQTVAETGEVLLYSSADLEHWDYQGPLAFTNEKMGYMIECPNLLFFGEQPVLIFCPQGLDPAICAYQNIYPNTYVIGAHYDQDTRSFVDPQPLQNLDEGFDVYATQAFEAPDGRKLAISWVGLPDIDYPTDQENWAHCLSLVKELTLKDQHLYQFPVKETENLRAAATAWQHTLQETPLSLPSHSENVFEMECHFDATSQGQLNLYVDADGQAALTLAIDAQAGTLTLTRTNHGYSFATTYGQTRTATVPAGEPLTLRLFVDRSVCEIFVNQGYRVFTSRVFPRTPQDANVTLTGNGTVTGTTWQLH